MLRRLLPVLAFLPPVALQGADWPHYRGAHMDGSTREEIPAWPAGGPKELWRVQLGTGCASVTVVGGRVFGAGYRDGREALQCLDANSGKLLWSHAWPAKLGDYLFGGGPRATPTVDGGRVYMLGADGHLACVDAATGKPVWEKEIVAEFGAKRMDWGFAGSPTVEGGLLLVDAGGKGSSTLALNKKSGAVVWKAGDDEAGYGSPRVAVVDGRKTVVVLKAEALVGHDLETGVVLWRHPWETSWKANAVTPVLADDLIVISSAYNHGAAAVRVKGGKPGQVWFTKMLKAHFNTPVVRDGSLFAIDGEVAKRSALVCLDVKTGDERWRAKEVKNGSVILAGDKLVLLTETGDLVLAEASAAAYKELGRATVLKDQCWVQPVLVDGVVYCKNNKGELVALKLAGK